MLVSDRRAWWLLAGSALALELVALWFQHGMQLDPCVKCVYERVAVFGIFFAGIIGSVYPASVAIRAPAYLLWLVSSTWGLRLAIEHVRIQSGAEGVFNCSFAAEFPAWAKLDEWLPALFQPTGYCDDVQWQFLTLRMAQWMIVVFAIYLAILAVVLILDLRGLLRSR